MQRNYDMLTVFKTTPRCSDSVPTANSVHQLCTNSQKWHFFRMFKINALTWRSRQWHRACMACTQHCWQLDNAHIGELQFVLGSVGALWEFYSGVTTNQDVFFQSNNQRNAGELFLISQGKQSTFCELTLITSLYNISILVLHVICFLSFSKSFFLSQEFFV